MTGGAVLDFVVDLGLADLGTLPLQMFFMSNPRGSKYIREGYNVNIKGGKNGKDWDCCRF